MAEMRRTDEGASHLDENLDDDTLDDEHAENYSEAFDDRRAHTRAMGRRRADSPLEFDYF